MCRVYPTLEGPTILYNTGLLFFQLISCPIALKHPIVDNTNMQAILCPGELGIHFTHLKKLKGGVNLQWTRMWVMSRRLMQYCSLIIAPHCTHMAPQ